MKALKIAIAALLLAGVAVLGSLIAVIPLIDPKVFKPALSRCCSTRARRRSANNSAATPIAASVLPGPSMLTSPAARSR